MSILCVCESRPINFWMPEPILIKFDMHIMAPEPISTAYFINPSRQSVSGCVSILSLQGNGLIKFIPPFSTTQRLGKHFPVATNTRCYMRIVGRVIFYAVRVLSKKSLWNYLCIPPIIAR
jgi:hypothetical protein